MDARRRRLQTGSKITRDTDKTDGSGNPLKNLRFDNAWCSFLPLVSLNQFKTEDISSVGSWELLPGLQTGTGWVEGVVGVEHRSVGRRSDRLPVQLHLLLRVSKLQRAGTLVRRGLLPVRQADGGGQIDEALGQVGVRRLEATRGVRVLEALRLERRLRLGMGVLRLPLQVG